MARGDLELVTDFVILGRSKERSDAAQTLESMPLLRSVARVRNSAPLQPLPKVTAWILGSSLRFAFATPKDDEVAEGSPARLTFARSATLPSGTRNTAC